MTTSLAARIVAALSRGCRESLIIAQIAHAEALSKAQLSELHMTRVEEEKDQSRRADKVIKHRAALCRLLALSGGSRMSALTPLLEVERTFVGRDENAAFDRCC
jgi:hypothetical protein